MHALQVLRSPPAPGRYQMALDEALLERCDAERAGFVPVLRLYTFRPACLSLGRFQPFADVDAAACARAGIDIVRRPTGGWAVLHDHDLTYALVAPADGEIFAGGVRASARRIGAMLLDAVRRLGADAMQALPPPSHRQGTPSAVAAGATGRLRGRGPDCFAVAGAYEVTIDGRKLIGSAQVRRGAAALQHGTVRLRAGTGDARPYLARTASTRHPASVATVAWPPPISLEEATGRQVTFDEAAAAIWAACAARFGLVPRASVLSDADAARASVLVRGRYATRGWTAAGWAPGGRAATVRSRAASPGSASH